MFVGDDWKGDPLFEDLEKELLKFGASIEYFEYTEVFSKYSDNDKLIFSDSKIFCF